MLPPCVRRLCIRLLDLVQGCLLYIPLIIIFVRSRCKSSPGRKPWDESQIPALDGKVVVVTGANTGIGHQTARHLALHGARVYLAARREEAAKTAIRRLAEEHPSIPRHNLIWLPLDLASQASVSRAARELRAKEKRLDILVNNAGVDPYEYCRTSDGFEMAMAVNHIGHWTLTYCLLPLLKKTAAEAGSDVRVVTTLRYGTSKQANILFASELQRRLDAENHDIISLSVQPGIVRTRGASRAMPWVARPLLWLFSDASSDQGARTSLFAATAEEVKRHGEAWKGRYLDGPGEVGVPSLRARDWGLACNLWHLTEGAVRATGALDKVVVKV
ncbi:short-chain dehydrogenase [Ophiocordyceps camponoti-floridani]|uniref:Short-chain dehydrogenase n=1 Tax=Ophiocordyceps camponoti-floridani TaxID=2030778 RepID=A0A8H4Q9T9_9HYPO|nr:short-chain dehydrogenase [Ophiocordyceps camponoti-floridani]